LFCLTLTETFFSTLNSHWVPLVLHWLQHSPAYHVLLLIFLLPLTLPVCHSLSTLIDWVSLYTVLTSAFLFLCSDVPIFKDLWLWHISSFVPPLA
jgi:hypothetical protein